LRYAIGEIFLVVIRILIALQINNWNENRKERLTEIKYLKNLKHDLQNDSIDLVEYKSIRLGIVNAAHELLRYAKLQQVNDVYRLDSLYVSVAMWYEFVPNDNTFEELRSSGNLQLIKNDSIKNLLLDLNKENEELISSRNHMRREYDYYLYDIRAKLSNFLDVNDPDKIYSILDWYYPNKQSVAANSIKVRNHFKTLFSNTTFINGLALAAGNNLWIVEEHYNNMLDDIHKLIKLIDQDLNN
jgi:hypothetical protein